PYVIRPVQEWLRAADTKLADRSQWADSRRRLIEETNRALAKGLFHVSRRGQGASDRIREGLLAGSYPRRNESLSRMALATLVGAPGVSSVLCGMRTPAYVRDAMAAVEEPLVDGLEILRRFGS
ncbi:MAG: hypothetical protein ACRD1Z_19390, partial [Vicinamibacteria bacterium]